MTDTTTPDQDTCQHHYVLDTIEENSGTTGRFVTFHCTQCAKPGSILTNKTDAQIADVFAEEAPVDAGT